MGVECIPMGTLFNRRGPYTKVVGNIVSSAMKLKASLLNQKNSQIIEGNIRVVTSCIVYI